jgi:hypothetical protein
MNTLTQMPNPASASTLSKSIIADDRLKGSVLLAGPGEEFPLLENPAATETYLVVLAGEVTVRSGSINTMLCAEEAVRLTSDRPRVVFNPSSGWAKLLRLDLADKRASEPLIVTLPN